MKFASQRIAWWFFAAAIGLFALPASRAGAEEVTAPHRVSLDPVLRSVDQSPHALRLSRRGSGGAG